MNAKSFLQTSLWSLALLPLWASPVKAASRPPNIVFILLDDYGWSDTGAYGGKFYQTPNIDRLAQQGMKFTQAYDACPVCSPTRASILTGKYPARLHLTDWLPGRADRPNQKLLRPQIKQQLPLEEVTVAEALKPVGYVSGAFGKWHLGGNGFQPQDQGFETYVAGNPKGRSPGSQDDEKGEFGDTEEAMKFVEANRGRPFLLYLPYNSTHIPLNARRELIAKYEKLAQSGARHTNVIYAAMIESVDEQIGRLLKKLDDSGLADHTVVFFTADNGGLSTIEGKNTPATSNFPLRAGKGYLYEGGVRIPLIVRWPGHIKPGSVCDELTSSVDYFPTMLEMAGFKKSPGQILDGQSLVPLLKQSGKCPAREIFWHYPHYANQGGHPGGAIRSGDFKLIEFYEDKRFELYDLKRDIGEKNNLAADNPALTRELAQKLADWRRSVDAQMPRPNPDYDPSLPRTLPSEQ